jgi:AcrR family transcriptional regulator
VSYHFRGKQELLIEAALAAFRREMPVAAFEALDTIDALLGMIEAELGDPEAIDPVVSRLMLEAMREAEREPLLRERMGGMLREYRELMVRTVRAEQERGRAFDGAPPEAIATLLGAMGDGLLMHVLLDRDVDVAGAVAAMRTLLAPRPRS